MAGEASIRRGDDRDLDFFVDTDLLGEGYGETGGHQSLTAEEQQEHRAKIAAFVAGGDDSAWICENEKG